MKKISLIIEEETKGKSFRTRKYFHASENITSIIYDDNSEIEWKEHGETEQIKKPKCLKNDAKKLKDYPSVFRYFLDGSRHTYKVDDISYKNNSNDFIFDTEFLAQAIFKKYRIGDIPVPTMYFKEASSINFYRSLRYGISCLVVLLKYVIQKSGLWRFKLFSDLKI